MDDEPTLHDGADALPLQEAEVDALFAAVASRPSLLLAVSGGSDSIALLHLMALWAQRQPVAPRLTVSTVDHGLRLDSGDDAMFVAERARQLGLPCTILTWSGEKPPTGRSEAARRARYRLLAEVARAQGAAIVTAHTRDDQAETVLMRLGRGSGPDGLGAMVPTSRVLDVALLRPLLDVPKSRLVATLAAAGVTWREDPSNSDTAYERVRVRRSAAARAALGLGDDALALAAARASRAAEALQAAAYEALGRIVRSGPLADWGAIAWPSARFAADEIEIRALRTAIRLVGGAAWDDPFAHAGPELAAIERLAGDLWGGGFRGATIGRVRLAVGAGDAILMVREVGREPLPEAQVQRGGNADWDDRWTIVIPPDAGPARVRAVAPTDAADIVRRAPDWVGSTLPAVVRQTIPVMTIGGVIAAVPGATFSSGVEFKAKLLQQLAKLRHDAAVRP